MRFTINDNSFLQSINIVRAYMTFELSSHYWNDYTIVYTGGALSGKVDTVFPKNTSGSGIAGPIAGKFYYTQAMSMSDTYTNMTDTGVSFSGRDGSTASVTTTHNINNSYPIRNILILITNWDNTKGNGCAIGNIQFSYSTKP